MQGCPSSKTSSSVPCQWQAQRPKGPAAHLYRSCRFLKLEQGLSICGPLVALTLPELLKGGSAAVWPPPPSCLGHALPSFPHASCTPAFCLQATEHDFHSSLHLPRSRHTCHHSVRRWALAAATCSVGHTVTVSHRTCHQSWRSTASQALRCPVSTSPRPGSTQYLYSAWVSCFLPLLYGTKRAHERCTKHRF